ncbi:MAG: NUDIX domain-containing protein [Bacteroidales bacterium]
MENQGKITIGTVCFLINKSNNTMLLLERANEPMSGMVTGVGGKTHFEEDINDSCIREIKEETGLDARNLKLHGVIKTILDGHNSTWILFIYSTANFDGEQINCPEGKLAWVNIDKIFDTNLIGFIREIMPYVLENKIIEGTIRHTSTGNVIEKNILQIS